MGRPVIAAIILARLDSRRFPGKALQKLGDKAVIEHVLRRLQACQAFDHIVLATTGRACDDPLALHFAELGGTVYRAPDDEFANVAKRFVSAAAAVGADYALRANGDSPFLDCWLIGQGIDKLTEQPDLVTNLLPRSYPYGISVELVRIATLAAELPALDDAAQEHVTACFYQQPDRFNIVSVPPCPWPPCQMRMTVDEPEDLDRLNALLLRLGPSGTSADMPAVIAAANALADDSK